MTLGISEIRFTGDRRNKWDPSHVLSKVTIITRNQLTQRISAGENCVLHDPLNGHHDTASQTPGTRKFEI
jgi:hypothetical protein